MKIQTDILVNIFTFITLYMCLDCLFKDLSCKTYLVPYRDAFAVLKIACWLISQHD